MLIRSAAPASLSKNLGREQKNAPQESGRRSNYAHLTSQNIRYEYHSFVKCDFGIVGGKKIAPENDEYPGADNYALFT